MGRLRLLLLLGAAALGAAVLAAAGKCRAPPALPSRSFCSLSPGPAGLRPRPRACRRGTCCGGGCGLPRGPALPAAAAGSRNPPPLRGFCHHPGGRFVAQRLAAPGLVVPGRPGSAGPAQRCWGLPCTPALPRSCCPVLRVCCHRLLPGSRFSTEGAEKRSTQGISLHRETLNPGSPFNIQPCPGLLGVFLGCF